jgi:hypothetical protein
VLGWGGFPLSSGEIASIPDFRSNSGLPFINRSFHLLLISLQMKMLPSNYLTGSQTTALVASGQLTVRQVIGDHRNRIEERDKDVLAWTCTNLEVPKPSLTKELCGITIGVKDIMSQ